MIRTKGWGRLQWIGSEIGVLSQERGGAGARAGAGQRRAPKEMDLLNTSDLDDIFEAISCPVFLLLPPCVVFLGFNFFFLLFVCSFVCLFVCFSLLATGVA